MNTQLQRSAVHQILIEADELRFQQQFHGIEPLYRALETTTATLARLERQIEDRDETASLLRDLRGITRNLVQISDTLAPQIAPRVHRLADGIAALGAGAPAESGIVALASRHRTVVAALMLPIAAVIVSSGVRSVMDRWFRPRRSLRSLAAYIQRRVRL